MSQSPPAFSYEDLERMARQIANGFLPPDESKPGEQSERWHQLHNICRNVLGLLPLERQIYVVDKRST